MNILTAKNLTLTLGKKTVVDDVDITINSNEFVGLIGPNGAGKSSILKMLTGLIPPKSGSVHLNINLLNNALDTEQVAIPIQKVPNATRARFMAYLAQHEIPAWPLSAKNLVALGRLPWSSGSGNDAVRNDVIGSDNIEALSNEAAITQALDMTDVSPLADRPVNELSGGEMQRVLLARVFAGNPNLIVADEPIAALDLYHQLHIMELLQAHAKTRGAVIAALHDLSLAARFCTRLILVHHGKIVADGAPVAVLTPENLAAVYGVSAHVDCREDGVVIIPIKRVAL